MAKLFVFIVVLTLFALSCDDHATSPVLTPDCSDLQAQCDSLAVQLCMAKKMLAEQKGMLACYRHWFAERGLELNHCYKHKKIVVGCTPGCDGKPIDLTGCGD